MLDEEPNMIGEHNTEQGGNSKEGCGPDGAPPGTAPGHHDARNSHALRQFVQQNSYKDHEAQRWSNQEGAGDRHTVKKSMQ